MGMSTHVVGFRPPDDEWNKMKAVWDACIAADIEPGGDVLEFFDHIYPDSPGMEVDITSATKEHKGEYTWGYDVDVSKLPRGVKVVRAYNSR